MNKNSIMLAFICVCINASLLYAHEADGRINKEKASYKANIPANLESEQQYIDPVDPSYEYYNRCQNPGDFKITNLAMVFLYIYL